MKTEIELNENSPEYRKQKFEEMISPFIRYGYNQALVDIEQYMASDEVINKYDIDTLTSIQDKIHEMMKSKRLVDLDKLMNDE